MPPSYTKIVSKKYKVGREDWHFASFVFVLSICANLFTAVVCLSYPPQSRDHAASFPIPTSATCFRATRKADYTTVELMVGTPPVSVSLLLRLDRVLPRSSAESTTLIFAHGVVKSKSVSCGADGRCSDVLLASDGKRDRLKRFVFNFLYLPATKMPPWTANALQRAGAHVSGEMHMRSGFAYWLTATHLCQDETGRRERSAPRRVNVSVSAGGWLHATQDALRSNPVTAKTPAASRCSENESASLFPVAAAMETSWLSLRDLSRSELDAVHERRHIVEVGTNCAANTSALSKGLVLYGLDCVLLDGCERGRSLPFRRVASASLFLDLKTEGDEWMDAQLDHTLDGLPRLAEDQSAVYASLLKMAMITLAASVVYVRSKRPTASSSWLIRNCISIYKDCGSIAGSTQATLTNNFEDRAVGFVAVCSRGVVVASRFGLLAYDGQARACTFEVAATLLSAVHWTLRYSSLVFIHDCEEPPISKLGGSTAIVDSTAAVMMAFSEPPTMIAANGHFDPIARMLVSILIATIVLSRCAFSAACCGSLSPKFMASKRLEYGCILTYSAFMWCFQSAAIAVNMCDLFVSPASYSMSRAVEGNPLPLRTALCFAVVCAGLPRLMATSKHVLSNKDHVD